MFQRRVCKHVGLVGALALSLVMCSRLAAQSNRASTEAQTEHAVLDNIDALQQISTAMQMLSKRVSASVVQIFSTGYIFWVRHHHRVRRMGGNKRARRARRAPDSRQAESSSDVTRAEESRVTARV
jgi:hypothetical protein